MAFSDWLVKRSIWRGICAGVLAHYLALLALILSYWVLRPFVWAAVYGVPYSPPSGPYDPNSGEWLFSQAMGIASWSASGYAATKWSPPRSPWAVATLVVLSLVLTAIGGLPVGAMLWRTALVLLAAPVGLLSGAALYVWLLRSPVPATDQ